MEEKKYYTFHLEGMHCRSCVVLIENELKQNKKVREVYPDLKTESVRISGDFGDATPDKVMHELAPFLSQHKLVQKKVEKSVAWSDFLIAFPLALVFILIFYFLQKIGLVNFIHGGEITFGTAFFIGLVASVSSCMAVVGGLLLSLSTTLGNNEKHIRFQLSFHVSRIVGFFLLGGITGILGNVLRLSIEGTTILGLILGMIMFILGINLLDVFHWAKRFQLSMPISLSRRIFTISGNRGIIFAGLLGVLTFFLPCGFTQSMQLYALSTGSFLSGGLVMVSFALGTLPALGLISLGSSEIYKSKYSGIFLKTAGIIVICFAVFNIINTMVAAGWITPIFSF